MKKRLAFIGPGPANSTLHKRTVFNTRPETKEEYYESNYTYRSRHRCGGSFIQPIRSGSPNGLGVTPVTDYNARKRIRAVPLQE